MTAAPRTVLATPISAWPRGTEVQVLEPFGDGLLVEVADAAGGTLDVIFARPAQLTVSD